MLLLAYKNIFKEGLTGSIWWLMRTHTLLFGINISKLYTIYWVWYYSSNTHFSLRERGSSMNLFKAIPSNSTSMTKKWNSIAICSMYESSKNEIIYSFDVKLLYAGVLRYVINSEKIYLYIWLLSALYYQVFQDFIVNNRKLLLKETMLMFL